jgi:alkylation response protein AidB-like acyl-CoA dehydrogenase
VTTYSAPLDDIDFVMNRICGLGGLAEIETFSHADPVLVRDLLSEANRFMSERIAPLNQVGDVEGSVRNADGSVTTPTGFVGAYQEYVDGGWGAVPFDVGYGGGGFPWMVGIGLQEIINSANMAFAMAPLLTQGAIDAIQHHADETLRMTYLPKMVSGEWTGTMNLTEPDAGSDVGALRTKAVRRDDGSYLITGTKIYITFGEHDMADNIVHLVLARTPDAPAGTKGISLFIVPKFLVNADGSLGDKNDVHCVSIEHKMGIKASPTCVLSYGESGEGAVGYIVGEENRGMAYMFTMMNQARLSVGIEGMALAERAYQQALEFSQQRRQGRAPGAPAGESSPIIDHPDVKRMLVTMKSTIEALRRMLYWNAQCLDLAAHHPDADVRKEADDIAALLTPLSKGWGTDMSVELTGIAVQVHGGMGFIEETGVAQHYRDARITTIYEGTNGIQGMDLVGRKLGLEGGAVITAHLQRIADIDVELSKHEALAGIRTALATSLAAVRTSTEWLFAHAGSPVDALAGATPYLRQLSTVTGGYLMARTALVATELLASGEGSETPEFLAAKVASARFFCEQLMPAADGLVAQVTAGADALMGFDAALLTSR